MHYISTKIIRGGKMTQNTFEMSNKKEYQEV